MDALIAIAAILIVWFAFKGVGWWRYFWLAIAIVLAAFEGCAVLVTHHSISQQFGLSLAGHPIRAAFLSILISFGGIGLGMHLWIMAKKFNRK